MKVGEFCDAIGVSGHSLRTFLGQTGNDKGVGSATYGSAWEFFKKRELKGIKAPTTKKRKVAEPTTTSGGAGAAAAAAPTAAKRKGNAGQTDLSGIELEGEADDAVPVFDSCDEIRRKINAHLRKDNVTQAGFARDLTAQFHSSKAPAAIQSAQITRFRGMTGPTAGNTSGVFYAAYVFFEKLRLKERGAKTKHRQGMEGQWPSGVDTERRMDRLWCGPGETPFLDQYGMAHIQRRH